jgi:hypothetical protein
MFKTAVIYFEMNRSSPLHRFSTQPRAEVAARLFLDSQDEIDALVGHLKTNEANGEKSVYLSFSGDLFGRPAMLNLITVDLSEFSNGFAALQTACAASK